LCSPCPNEINKNKDEKQKEVQKKEYRKNISYIIKILDGKFLNVKNSLDKKMKTLSDNEKFEEAILIRRKIEQLDYITRPINAADSFLKNPNLLDDIRKREVDNLSMIICEYSHKKTVIRRIECYDVAHISGSYPSASMVTFINGEPVKKYYRQFNIRQGKSRSDTASLFEVARRRINHLKDWGIPDLIIVDGGVAQVKTFLKAFNKENIIITGIAKSPDRLIIRSKKGLFNKIILRGPSLFLVQRLRDEAHRFARRYYKKRLQNSLKLTE
jgi:excinuclease ABC subunit C